MTIREAIQTATLDELNFVAHDRDGQEPLVLLLYRGHVYCHDGEAWARWRPSSEQLASDGYYLIDHVQIAA